MAVIQAPVFVLTPTGADNLVIDYTSSEGLLLYTLVITRLKFASDMNSSSLKIFMQTMQQHTQSSNWAQKMTILDNCIISQSIVDIYGLITIKDIHAHLITYFWQHYQYAQNSYQLYTCLTNSTPTNAAV